MDFKLSGYFVDIGRADYANPNGKCSDSTENYIDIFRKVGLSADGRTLRESNSENGIESNDNYRPVGERVGHSFNSIFFSFFNLSKGGRYLGEEGPHCEVDDEYHIILPCGTGIHLNDQQTPTDKTFYKNFSEIKKYLESKNSLSIGCVFGEKCSSSSEILPGISQTSPEDFSKDPIKFINDYCNDSNPNYQILKNFILKMHNIFHGLNYTIEGSLNFIPHIILPILGRAYYSLNRSGQFKDGKLLYQLSIPSELDGLNAILIKNLLDHPSFFSVEEYQPPRSIGFTVQSFHPDLFEKFKKDDLFSAIVHSPLDDEESLKVIKMILNTQDMNLIKKKSFFIPYLNKIEPNYNSICKSKKRFELLTDESYIKSLSQTILSNGMMGLVMFYDRATSDPKKQIPPVSNSFDLSIKNLNPKENFEKTKQFISYLNLDIKNILNKK